MLPWKHKNINKISKIVFSTQRWWHCSGIYFTITSFKGRHMYHTDIIPYIRNQAHHSGHFMIIKKAYYLMRHSVSQRMYIYTHIHTYTHIANGPCNVKIQNLFINKRQPKHLLWLQLKWPLSHSLRYTIVNILKASL